MSLPFFVGSLPFQSVPEAIDFVKKNSAHLPFLPQLPELNPKEDMIGQVLRGFELGYWDESASCALERFQNEFCESERFKIQIAGPYTVARALSLKTKEIWPQWKRLILGLVEQFRQGGFLGEMWIQIDEPFWSKETCPEQNYFQELESIKVSQSKVSWGMHSCASLRPELNTELLKAFRFLSFDCLRAFLSEEEKNTIEKWLKEDPQKIFVWGGLENGGLPKEPDEWVNPHPRVWASASCGLAFTSSAH